MTSESSVYCPPAKLKDQWFEDGKMAGPTLRDYIRDYVAYMKPDSNIAVAIGEGLTVLVSVPHAVFGRVTVSSGDMTLNFLFGKLHDYGNRPAVSYGKDSAHEDEWWLRDEMWHTQVRTFSHSVSMLHSGLFRISSPSRTRRQRELSLSPLHRT